MKGNHRGLLAFLLMGVLLLAASTPASAELTAYGEVSDPVGDSMDPSADLVFGSISITSTGDAIFRAFYAPGFDITDSEIDFVLDIDKNPLTGQAWLGMGVEGVVQVYGTAFGGTGGYWTPGTPWPWPNGSARGGSARCSWRPSA